MQSQMQQLPAMPDLPQQQVNGNQQVQMAPQQVYSQPYPPVQQTVPQTISPNSSVVNVSNLSQTQKTEIKVIAQSERILSCGMILCACATPTFSCCQCCIGCWTAFSGGVGLETGACCCYGCGRPDCCAVCCAGIWLNITSTCLYGIVTSCIIGWKLMLRVP